MSTLTEYAVALAPRQPFRRVPGLLRRVVAFLAARLGELGDMSSGMARSAPGAPVRYMCTAHGCRASVVDMLDFLDHVHDERM